MKKKSPPGHPACSRGQQFASFLRPSGSFQRAVAGDSSHVSSGIQTVSSGTDSLQRASVGGGSITCSPLYRDVQYCTYIQYSTVYKGSTVGNACCGPMRGSKRATGSCPVVFGTRCRAVVRFWRRCRAHGAALRRSTVRRHTVEYNTNLEPPSNRFRTTFEAFSNHFRTMLESRSNHYKTAPSAPQCSTSRQAPTRLQTRRAGDTRAVRTSAEKREAHSALRETFSLQYIQCGAIQRDLEPASTHPHRTIVKPLSQHVLNTIEPISNHLQNHFQASPNHPEPDGNPRATFEPFSNHSGTILEPLSNHIRTYRTSIEPFPNHFRIIFESPRNRIRTIIKPLFRASTAHRTHLNHRRTKFEPNHFRIQLAATSNHIETRLEPHTIRTHSIRNALKPFPSNIGKKSNIEAAGAEFLTRTTSSQPRTNSEFISNSFCNGSDHARRQ